MPQNLCGCMCTKGRAQVMDSDGQGLGYTDNKTAIFMQQSTERSRRKGCICPQDRSGVLRVQWCHDSGDRWKAVPPWWSQLCGPSHKTLRCGTGKHLPVMGINPWKTSEKKLTSWSDTHFPSIAFNNLKKQGTTHVICWQPELGFKHHKELNLSIYQHLNPKGIRNWTGTYWVWNSCCLLLRCFNLSFFSKNLEKS